MDSDFGAVAINGDPTYEIEFSFCTLVTKPEQYFNMVRSFQNRGFDKSNSEYLYLDNSLRNSGSAFSGLNRLARFARGEYLIFCHQDIVAVDDPNVLRAVIADLTERDPKWAVMANAGFDGDEGIYYLNDPLHVSVGANRRPAKKVTSVDENLIILKREAQLGFSADLDGFHLYGTDIVTQAHVRGHSAYVADFRVEHLSGGSIDSSFYSACLAFERKYARAFDPRWVLTTCTSLDIGTTKGRGRRDRLQNLKRGKEFVRTSQKIKKALHGWATRNTVDLHGARLHYPAKISVAEFKSLKKGRFEQERAELIIRHLPEKLPNVVLGASYGVVCHMARKKLADDVPQICVEQYSDLIDICSKNSVLDKPESDTQVTNSVIFYPEVADKSGQSGELSSMLTDPQEQPSVAAEMSLGGLLKKVALDGPYSLICNIGGTEFDLIEYDQGALSRCGFLLVTLHPDSYYRRNERVMTFIERLSALGFEIVDVSGNHVAAVRLNGET